MADIVFPVESIKIAENNLIHSVEEMDKGLTAMGITQYDLDNLTDTLLSVYDFQQEKYNKEKVFSVFSLVGMAFLELGIIEKI